MILTILTVAMYGAAGGAAALITGYAIRLAYLTWRDHQRDIGHGYGTIDGFKTGDARGYTRGYSQACLDHVLATPTEAQSYAEVVAAIPGANDLADAIRLNAVRRSVQGREGMS